MKFKITNKKKFIIELQGTDKAKTPLQVGYTKSVLFLKLNGYKVGEEVEVDVETSDKGNLYATDSNKFLFAMQEAKKFMIEEKNIANLLSQGTV